MNEPLRAATVQRETIPTWTLGWRLQRSLAHARMSVEQMAQELGVSRSTISRWLNDRGMPNRAIIRVWAELTGVPRDWLGGPECAIRDSNPEPAGLGDEVVSQAELKSFLKSMGRTGVIRPAVRSRKLVEG